MKREKKKLEFKKTKRTTKGSRSRTLVQRMAYFKVLVDGDLGEFRQVIESYRMLVRKLDAVATAAQVIEGEITSTKTGDIRIKGDGSRLHTVLAALTGREVAKAKYYELRPLFMKLVEQIREQGGPNFGSHMWDMLGHRLNSIRDRVLPDYKNIARSRLVVAGKLDMPPVRRLAMPIMRTSGRNYAHFIEDEQGKRIRIQWGKKADSVDLIVKGSIVTAEGKFFAKEASPSIGYLFHKFASGEWDFQTLEVNIDEDGKATAMVPYRRPREKVGGLNPKSALEVCFKTLSGTELPQRKGHKSVDDLKTYVIHCFYRTHHGFRRSLRIPVNDVIAQLCYLSKRAAKLETLRDCSRKDVARRRKPLKDAIRNITRRRGLQQRHANHRWTNAILKCAIGWCCRTIKVFGLPDGKLDGLLLDGTHQWQWSQFLQFLTYKAEEAGIKISQIKQRSLVNNLLNELSDETPEEEFVAAD